MQALLEIGVRVPEDLCLVHSANKDANVFFPLIDAGTARHQAATRRKIPPHAGHTVPQGQHQEQTAPLHASPRVLPRNTEVILMRLPWGGAQGFERGGRSMALRTGSRK